MVSDSMIKYRHLETRVAVLCFLNSYISFTKINIFTGLITSILRKIKHWHVNHTIVIYSFSFSKKPMF